MNWLYDDANRRGFLDYLYDEQGFSVRQIISVVEKPWHWTAEFDEYMSKMEARADRLSAPRSGALPERRSDRAESCGAS